MGRLSLEQKEIKEHLFAEYFGEQETLYGYSISLYNVHCCLVDTYISKKNTGMFMIGSTVTLDNLDRAVKDLFIGQCRVSI